MTEGFTERASLIGPNASLLGVLALPAAPPRPDRPAVVILNTGTNHRIGHHRMYVDLARAFARAGHPTLRFDFAGIGDSAPPESDARPILETNLRDLRAAVDWLIKTAGTESVALVGLCAGADHAILYGPTDPRVVGLVLIDPFIPETARFFVHYAVRRIRSIGLTGFHIMRSTLLHRIARRYLRRFLASTELQHISFPGPNARETLHRSYGAALAAGDQLLVVCTGGDRTPRQTYREQFLDAFRGVPFGTALRLEFFRDCDHTFSSPAERKRLNAVTLDWIAHAPFPSRAGAAPEPENGRSGSPAGTEGA